MTKFIDSGKLFGFLNDERIYDKKAKEVNEIVEEINKVSSNLNQQLKNLNADQAIKKILWEGILNQYGTYGTKSGKVKEFSKKDKNGKDIKYNFNQKFTKGKLLSIDFGTSNIDRELSLTHTGVVLADYTGMVIVVPITSQSSIEYSNLSQDIQNDIIPIYTSDYPQIKNDSYVLMHQLRVVSKNRITKKGIIGSLSNTDIMKKIEEKFMKIIAYDYYIQQQTKIKRLEEIINSKETVEIK